MRLVLIGLSFLASCDGDSTGHLYDPAGDCVTATYYADDDLDGHGNSDRPVESCYRDNGLAVEGGDCDDNDPNANPGAVEVCDEIDNDCNGSIDDGVGDLYYEDWDDDGYGDSARPTTACETPDGYTARDGDCDDRDSSVNPGEEDTFGDDVDADCNGVDDWTDYPYEGTYSGSVECVLEIEGGSDSDSYDCEGEFSLEIRSDGTFRDGSADCSESGDPGVEGEINGAVDEHGTATGTWTLEYGRDTVDLELTGSIGGNDITLFVEEEVERMGTLSCEMQGDR